VPRAGCAARRPRASSATFQMKASRARSCSSATDDIAASRALAIDAGADGGAQALIAERVRPRLAEPDR
jgi:hypothetical protein